MRRAHPTGDLAQCPLGVGGPGEVAARPVELLDEPGVGDGDGGLAGQRADEAGVGLGERGDLLRVDLDDPERTAVAGDRRGDHRVEARAVVELGRFGRRRELGRQVVVGEDDPALGDRDAGRAHPDRDPQGRPLLVAEALRQPVVDRPVQVAVGRVEQVEDHPVGPDEAPGLRDDVAQDLARLAQDGDPGGDLAERLLGLRPPAEGVARPVELLDQAGRPDGDGGLVGDGLEQAGIAVVPRVGSDRSTR